MSWANNVSRTLLYDIVCIPDLTWFMVYCQKHIHWLIVHEMIDISPKITFPTGPISLRSGGTFSTLSYTFRFQFWARRDKRLRERSMNRSVKYHGPKPFNTIFVWLVTLTLVITAPFYKKYVRTSCMHICCFQSLITPFASSHWKNNYIEWNWRNWKFENSVLHFLMLIIVTQTKMHFKIEEEFWSDSDEKCIGTLQFFPF